MVRCSSSQAKTIFSSSVIIYEFLAHESLEGRKLVLRPKCLRSSDLRQQPWAPTAALLLTLSFSSSPARSEGRMTGPGQCGQSANIWVFWKVWQPRAVSCHGLPPPNLTTRWDVSKKASVGAILPGRCKYSLASLHNNSL